MRHHVVGLCILLTLLTAACTGTHARTNVLIPAMELAWPGVRADAEAGGADATILTDFEAALAARDKVQIVVQWPAVKTTALVGISARVDAGEISPGVAASFTERVTNFQLAVDELARRMF